MAYDLALGVTWADYAIIATVGISVVISLVRGFVREALSLTTWIAAFLVSFKFHDEMGTILAPYIVTPTFRLIASFAALFVITLILGGLLGFLLSRIIFSTGLGGTDKSLGLIFGFARGILLVGITLLLLSLTSFPRDDWWQRSALIPHFQPLTSWLQSFLPGKMEQVSNLVVNPITSKLLGNP